MNSPDATLEQGSATTTFTPTRSCSLACRSRIERRVCKVWWVFERPRSKADTSC